MTSVRQRRSDELTLDQMLAEPIVRLVMNRDGIDEAATRRLLREVAAARDLVMDPEFSCGALPHRRTATAETT